MKQVFKKIPITFWTLILIMFCSLFVFEGDFKVDKNRLDVLTSILTIAGLYYLAIQVNNQTKSERISNEFLNQPNFEFNGFCQDTIIQSKPKLCCEPASINYNQCSDIHWFDFKQVGNLPAKNVKISLIHENEKKDFSELISKRTQEEQIIYKDDTLQFKLSPFIIPISHLDPKANGIFLILLEYRSVYTNIRYKRVYQLNYSPAISPTSSPTTWINAISFFSLYLKYYSDSETTTILETLKTFGNRILNSLNIKKSLGIEEWLMNV